MTGRLSAGEPPSLSSPDHPDVTLAARLDVPLLVEGDTSAARRTVARAVHERGMPVQSPWLAVDCSPSRLEGSRDDLFDCCIGSDGDLGRWFDVVAGGTLFLDDVSHLHAGGQAQLATFLETTVSSSTVSGRFARRVRLIVGAAPRLSAEVAAGRFSECLFYRLNVMRLECSAVELFAARRLTVREVMATVPHTCQLTTDLASVVQIMWNRDCGFVPVLDSSGRVAGVVTDRDICIATATRRRLPEELSAAQVMTSAVRTCTADDSMDTALETMRDARVRRLPVVDGHARLQGVLSINDIVRVAGRKGAPDAPAVAAALVSISQPRTLAAAVA